MKLIKMFEGIFIALSVILACGIESNVLLGVASVFFLIAFFLLTKLEESMKLKWKNRKYHSNCIRNDDIVFVTYDNKGRKKEKYEI